MKFSPGKRVFSLAILLFVILSVSISFSQAEEPPPKDTITRYRKVLETEKDPQKIAEAHYKVGAALEKLGRETEATAEYLKIIINYPQITSINKKAEEGLSRLYSGFSERARELAPTHDETAGQKDPTIFFAYVKSLYENYKNLGQYDKAMHILETLYDMDAENPSYIIDMGEIYLHGYNDADKAIFYFKKAARINPENPRAYVDLGRAYEKKNDYGNAVSSYTKASEIAAASPWAIYGLRRIEGMRLARDKRLVKDWYFLGPFDNSDREGLKRRFPPEEKINLKAAYTGKDGVSIKWKRPFSYDASGYVDLNMLFEPNDYAVAYGLTYAHSPRERKAQFRLGSEDGIKIWLNDMEVFRRDVSGSAEVDDDLIAVDLKKGWNKILVKVSDTWGSWGFYFRVTDLKGNPVEDLIFDPLRDDDRVKYIYGQLVREKRFKFTKIAAIYAVAVSALLFGLYFMISNIHSKIKINRMKEDFISSVSHELKTPIAAVKMLGETLKRGRVREEARKGEYYDMIIRESDRLTRFINKILNFSRIEKGGKIFYFEKTNMVEVAKAAVDIYRDEAQDKGLKIQCNAEKEELFTEIDKDAILQVILNLIDNAYKYSKEEKEITVNIKDAKKDVRVEVIDKGLGIPKESIEKIFDKFYRVDRDMIREVKGSGLGLSFVKSVIDAHNGKIGVESEIGKGTKFIILLPQERT